MTWDEIFKNYWDNEDDWKEGIIQHLKNNYNPPIKKQKGFSLNENKCTVLYNGQEFKLQKKTFNMLKYIYQNKDRVVTRDEIYENVWNGVIVEEKTIDSHVIKIKKAIPKFPLQILKKVGIIWSE